MSRRRRKSRGRVPRHKIPSRPPSAERRNPVQRRPVLERPKLASFGAVGGTPSSDASPDQFGICVAQARRGNWVRSAKKAVHANGFWASDPHHWEDIALPNLGATDQPGPQRPPGLGSFGAIVRRALRAANPSGFKVGIAQPRPGNWVRLAKNARFAPRPDCRIVKERRKARPSRFIRSAEDGSEFHEFGNRLGNFRGLRGRGAKPPWRAWFGRATRSHPFNKRSTQRNIAPGFVASRNSVRRRSPRLRRARLTR